MRRIVFGATAALVVALLLGCRSTDESDAMMMSDETLAMSADMMVSEFTVTVEVLSDSDTPIAPLAWAIHTGPNPFVTGDMGERLRGLEALAEDGDPEKAAETLGMMDMVVAHGVAATPVGQADPGPAFPGAAYSFTVKAHEGERLSFATMYVQSNDLFYSPFGDGLPLFATGAPVAGDVTDRIVLYDAGTEVNEEPGMGPNQAPRQSGPNSGLHEMGMVAPVADTDMMYMYAGVNTVIRVTVEPHEALM